MAEATYRGTACPWQYRRARKAVRFAPAIREAVAKHLAAADPAIA